MLVELDWRESSCQSLLKYGWLEKKECKGTYQRWLSRPLDDSGGIFPWPALLYDSQLRFLPHPLWQEGKMLCFSLVNCAAYDSVGQPFSIDLLLVGTVGQKALLTTDVRAKCAFTFLSARSELTGCLFPSKCLILLLPLGEWWCLDYALRGRCLHAFPHSTLLLNVKWSFKEKNKNGEV